MSGLLECVATIKCGKATIEVPFTGGSLSGYGIVPAQYSTENPVIQAIIENSDYYKSGKIVKLRDVEGSGRFELKEAGVKAQGKGAEETGVKAPGTGAAEIGADAQGTVTAEGGQAKAMEMVEVTDIDDARDWLVENRGLKRIGLRGSAELVKKVAEEHGVMFVGL
jgi:hypothetical protein